MLNMFSRNVSYSDRQKEDRDSRDVFERYIPIKQEIIFRKEKDKMTEETISKRTKNDPVPDQNETIPVLLKQIVDRDKEVRQTFLYTQCIFQNCSPFSGHDPKPKSEASFEEWK